MKKPNNIVILTGAGISAESGIQTFRASDGLWHNHRVEDVATPEAFERDPELVQTFYNQRREQLLSPEIAPNAAHRALAKLEKQHTGSVLVVTQNIDNLHERGGSDNVLHMHGELLKMRCTQSQHIYPLHQSLGTDDPCECCKSQGTLRPHIVWFGEMPIGMEEIYEAIDRCDLFMAIGTSGNVYPAAGFVEVALEARAHTVEINLEPSKIGSRFAEQRYGKATTVVPDYVEELLA